jgi:hypothetical protein
MLGTRMSVKVTIIKSGNRNVRFETERNLRTTPVSQEGRESAAEAREELKIPAKPIRSMLAYTARNIVKKQGVPWRKHWKSLNVKINRAKREEGKERKKGASRTVYSYGGKAVKSIVSGGGPGTGKRR